MEIPLNARVDCTDGKCGHSVYVLIDPIVEKITHLVIRESSIRDREYKVPISLLTSTAADTIQLSISRADLEKMETFIQTEYIEKKVPDLKNNIKGGDIVAGTFFMPYVVPQKKVFEPVKQFQIPAGELAVRRGAHVEATDGYIGIVDEFVVDADSCNCQISHLVMRERHLFGPKEVIIPVSAIDATGDDLVHLNMSKKEIESLPTFPVKRRWS
jgi:hypothetical protein